MGILLKLSALAVRPFLRTACKALGLPAASEGVSNFLIERFTNHSTKLNEALQRANDRAWKTLEFSLAEDSVLNTFARADDKDFRDKVQAFLARIRAEHPAGGEPDFRACCREELGAARKNGLLDYGNLEPTKLASEVVVDFARFASPSDALAAQWQALEEMEDTFPPKEYPHLSRLLKYRSPDGFSILTASVRYFFRREVLKDQELRHESLFADVEKIREELDNRFEDLGNKLDQNWQRVDEALSDFSEKLDKQGKQIAELTVSINRLLETHQLSRRLVTSQDSFSSRDEAEREYIRQLVAQYRALPSDQRNRRLDLLNGIGKLQVVGGDYEGAERDFRELAGLVTEPGARAEAFYNAYQVALEKRDLTTAYQQLSEACKIDPARFAPFPMQRYIPERILGAGGFGVAFLCLDSNLKRPVVVKALLLDNLDQDGDAVLAEARILLQLEHPAVVKLFDCDYSDRVTRSRPYLVMEYFESTSLEDHVRRNKPLAQAEVLVVARQVAEALQTAHGKGIFHRDVKPANLLVRQDASGWQVKLIDFGLALKHGSTSGNTVATGRTVLGSAIAGTLEYAAPEQLGRLRGVRPGPPADIYSFAKTCCYALFGTTQPFRKHWAEIPSYLVELLESSLSENPHERPQDFGAVLRDLAEGSGGTAANGGRDRILDHFQKRLGAGINRSPVLKVSTSKTGRLLDVSRLAAVNAGVPARLLTSIIGEQGTFSLDLRPVQAIPAPAGSGLNEPDITSGLYDLIDRKIRRHAETAKRETGVHALWLGYPLLYASKTGAEADRWILAPLFLWPVVIDPEAKLEKHLRIGRARDPEAARFNRVMAFWVRRELGLSLPAPQDEELTDLTLDSWRDCLKNLSSHFSAERLFDFQMPLEAVPDRKMLQEGAGFRVLHAAVLGYFRWQNEAILADLEAIRDRQDLRGVVNGFVSTARLAQPAEVEPPPEEDRFLVCDADFSQERVVWQARSGPGLVVHGPPGTGKSQTIVNVIADTLARGRTVLMVCQKQAATRVVLERLRAVGLADLCLEIHDAELDRKEVFRAIKSQAETLGDAPTGQSEREREQWAQEIAALERELDDHALAFHQPLTRYGLSYRDMKALEQEQYAAFPTVRPLPSLQRVLEGLSWTTMEGIARQARDAGRWFAEGDALHNPWRFGRLTEIHPSLALRADVQNILIQLRAHDALHVEHLSRHGPGMALPPNLSHFPEVGSEVLQHLRPLVAARQSLILCWLPVIRKLGEEDRQARVGYVKKVVDLAERIRTTPPDPRWEAFAEATADFTPVAEEVMARLEPIHTAKQAGSVCLTECWLRALRGAPAEKLSEYRRNCCAAGELAGKLSALPSDPVWEPIHRRIPNFEEVVAPVMHRIEELASGQKTNLGTAAQAWLKVIRGASPEKLQRYEAECQQALQLAELVANLTAKASNGTPAPDSPELVNTCPQVLARLDQLRGSPPSPKAIMARCWLRAVRRFDAAELRKRASECREAIELARQAGSAAPDPSWEGVCGTWTAPQLAALRVQAEEFLRKANSFGRFFSGSFRRAKRQLRRLRPDAPPESFPAVATSLVEYVSGRQEQDRLTALNRRLVPDYPVPADGLALSTFPSLALEALEAAAWLVSQERRHPQYTPVLDEFLWQDGRPGPAEAALRNHVERCSATPRLEKANETLIPGFHPKLDTRGHLHYPRLALKGFEEAVWLLRQEQQNPWIAPLLDAFAHEKGPARTAPVRALHNHLARTRLRPQLALANRALVPSHQPPADEPAQVRYHTEAAAALESAAHLWQLTARHTWTAPLLDGVLTGNSPAQGPSLAGLKEYLRSGKRRENLAQANRTLVPGVAPPANPAVQLQFPRVAFDSLQKALRLQELGGAHPWVGPILDAFLTPTDPAQPSRALAELELALQRCPLVKVLLDTLSHLTRYFQGEGIREPYLAAKAGQTLTPWASRLEKGLDGLQALINLEFDRRNRSGPAGEVLKALEEYEQARAAGQKVPVPEASLQPDRHGDWWAALVNCSGAAVWQASCHASSPVLNRLTPDVLDGKVRQLKELLDRKRSLEAQVIRERWLVRQQPFRNEPWNRLFQERTSRKAPSKSLREAVELSWDKGLPALRPCWLASPGAASQIFPLSPGLFDLVIFDEASQCPVEQAVPTIYRGKNLVVSGDEKQLPPTAFFSAGSEIDEDEVDEADLEADDSPAETQRRRERRAQEESLMGCSDLLEAAIGKVKQLYLCVHYRSDHPALIEFSNRAFYNGQLEAPPARKVSIEGERPIEYHAVNGQYTDRTNPEEARHVVTLLKKLWSLPLGSPTLGIVTFNQAQRDRIEDLLEEEGRKDERFNTRYCEERDRRENNQDVGFFVKNLENVQGDERDVMIFSTTFGRDVQGRFFRRFGPVGVAGGHRRLNVAITRARKQVMIVGSMPIEQIANLVTEVGGQRTPAGYLQLYLAYAQAVSAGNEKESRRILDSLNRSPEAQRLSLARETPLEADVRAVLDKLGYRVERGVGDAGFYIDLAVLHPDANQGYILGIECDGGACYRGRSARIREVWRPAILERRGWRLHRVWSSYWWMNRDAAIRRLQASLTAALR